ncbi:MAG: hypothetical protein NWT00_11470, partial [Beijerinckiaceae bacterium]|nr:hypothetical protein [Beijerinckiaceae bacterium]
MLNHSTLAIRLLTMCAAAVTTAAHAKDMAQDKAAAFYKDNPVTIIVGSSPGGGYDTYARLLSRHMGKYIPGEPKFVVQNMPGAGCPRAAGDVAPVVPMEGAVIAAAFRGQPLGRVLL